MLALSVSISTSSSPRETSSPSDLSHFRIVPSSIESDKRGIATSAMSSAYTPRRGGGSCSGRRPGLGRRPVHAERRRRREEEEGSGAAARMTREGYELVP